MLATFSVKGDDAPVVAVENVVSGGVPVRLGSEGVVAPQGQGPMDCGPAAPMVASPRGFLDVEGGVAHQHVVDDHAQAPEVGAPPIGLLIYNFRGHVDQGAATGAGGCASWASRTLLSVLHFSGLRPALDRHVLPAKERSRKKS